METLPIEVVAYEIATKHHTVLNGLLRSCKYLRDELGRRKAYYEGLGMGYRWVHESRNDGGTVKHKKYRVNGAGLKHGPCYEYATGGAWDWNGPRQFTYIYRESHYRFNKLWGRRREWWACSGEPVLRLECHYVNDKLHGIRRIYHAHTGIIGREATFFRGNKRGIEKYRLNQGNFWSYHVNYKRKRVAINVDVGDVELRLYYSNYETVKHYGFRYADGVFHTWPRKEDDVILSEEEVEEVMQRIRNDATNGKKIRI
nr:hypothetical protein K-LCC10_0136 [Kaumoebavirus]